LPHLSIILNHPILFMLEVNFFLADRFSVFGEVGIQFFSLIHFLFLDCL
jgi:hypothetical protein